MELTMRFQMTVSLCAAALMPYYVAAAPRQPLPAQTAYKATNHAADLGAVQAVVDFCSKIDPKDGKRFEQQGNKVLPPMSEDRIEAARKTGDYKQAYATIQSVLKGLASADASRDCAAIL
jgi:hypothetical protein